MWAGLMRAIAALKHRNFRIFWTGQLISLIGTWMQNLAQGWLVLTLTDSPFLLGIVSAVQFTPMLLFSLLAGVVADRLPNTLSTGVSIQSFLSHGNTLAGVNRYCNVSLYHLGEYNNAVKCPGPPSGKSTNNNYDKSIF